MMSFFLIAVDAMRKLYSVELPVMLVKILPIVALIKNNSQLF